MSARFVSDRKPTIMVTRLLAVPVRAQTNPVATAINQLGLDVLESQSGRDAPATNALLSPYSISTALAMAYVGADGATREEMQRVLHLPGDEAAMLDGHAGIARALTELQENSRRRVEDQRRYGGESEPTTIDVANRFYAQGDYAFRPAFTDLLRQRFGAPLEEMDFIHAAEPGRVKINAWVAKQTRDKIRDLIPKDALNEDTRGVLVNALYLRAPWMEPFRAENTKSEPFWIAGKTQAEVATMRQQEDFRYDKRDDYAALALPYADGALQFLVLLPDKPGGLDALGKKVTPELLAECARLPVREVILHLPKFKLEPPSVPLSDVLKKLGMRTAFDEPPRSANFDRMAPRKPDDYLYISEVFHQAWMALDEKGTEAAAATAVVMARATSAPIEKPPPVEVRVDRPFLFAIQHVPSGACLFLGRVIDPRSGGSNQ
jgi:serpin B